MRLVQPAIGSMQSEKLVVTADEYVEMKRLFDEGKYDEVTRMLGDEIVAHLAEHHPFLMDPVMRTPVLASLMGLPIVTDRRSGNDRRKA